MTDKIKIKVIKKDAVKKPQVRKSNEKRSKQTAAREMVANVTNWVSDFQQRKRDETKLAIEHLFAQKTRPSES